MVTSFSRLTSNYIRAASHVKQVMATVGSLQDYVMSKHWKQTILPEWVAGSDTVTCLVNLAGFPG